MECASEPIKFALSPNPIAKGDEFLETNNWSGKSTLIATKANAPLISLSTSLPASKKSLPNLIYFINKCGNTSVSVLLLKL